jgi:hypothetical protein
MSTAPAVSARRRTKTKATARTKPEEEHDEGVLDRMTYEVSFRHLAI